MRTAPQHQPFEPQTGRFTIVAVTKKYATSKRFLIAATTDKGLRDDWYTWNAFRATLCDQARKLERPVTATVCDTWYGRELQAVTLAEELTEEANELHLGIGEASPEGRPVVESARAGLAQGDEKAR